MATLEHGTAVNRKELFLRACRGEAVERLPVWMMRQAGRYLPEYRALRQKHTFLETCKTPELAAEVSLQPFRLLDVDAIIVFSDILIPAEAMGMPLEIGDGGPVLANPLRDAAAVAGLCDFDPEKETRFLGDAIRAICKAAGPGVPLLGFAGAPWTLACYMVEGRSKDGFPAAKHFLYRQPDAFRELLSRIARNTASYLKAQIAAGAAAVQLFDTWAGELSIADYETYALPATQELVTELKRGESAQTPVILYSKASSHLLSSLARSGADVLSVDWRMDLAQVRKVVGPRLSLQGNVDPCILLGPLDGIRQAVRNVIDATGGAGHIVNLGHGILPSTPVENAHAFVRAAQATPLPGRAAIGSK